MKLACAILCVVTAAALSAQAPVPRPTFSPKSGIPGKDVVWVPTPPGLLERMLDVAQVAPGDYVIDLGSGDGRNVIAAARRGARALGVEFNPDLVVLSRRLAAEAHVSDKARFVEGDMYEADISSATVLVLYLLPANMTRLAPRFLGLRPGTRIVANTFGPKDWDPDYREAPKGVECRTWCEVLLWIVPARAAGTWRLSTGATLVLQQSFQILFGAVTVEDKTTDIGGGRLRGDEIRFESGGAQYIGRVSGDTIEGTMRLGGSEVPFKATRTRG